MSESGCGGLIALGALAVAIYSCSGRDAGPSEISATASAQPSVSSQDGADEKEEATSSFDEDAAREQAEEELSSSSYADEGATYGCTDDCTGHEAGWRWRAEQGYRGSNPGSPSFEEGGQAFDDAVEDRVQELRSEHEDGGI